MELALTTLYTIKDKKGTKENVYQSHCQSHASHFITNCVSIIYQIPQLALLGLKDYEDSIPEATNAFQNLVNKVRQLIRSKFKEQEEQNKDTQLLQKKSY